LEVRNMSEKYSPGGLALLGWFRDVSSDGEREPILYAVTGLSPDDNCIIGYAGRRYDGRKKWYLEWYRAGELLKLPEISYGSPQDALEAVAKLNGTV
jgi:hypothetical protein